MFRWIALSLLALLLASPAWSEICTAAAAPSRMMIGQTTPSVWPDCTPSADDDYVVSGSSQVFVGADVQMESLTINSATAKLTILPGAKIEMGAGDVDVQAGTLELMGAVEYGGRIDSVDYKAYATGIDITLERAPGVTLTTGDHYLVVWDEDPENIDSGIVGSVQIGDGEPVPGAYRPSYGKWLWYRITNIASDVVTVSWDEFDNELTGTYGTDEASCNDGTNYCTPYEGQRSVPVLTAAPITGEGWTPTLRGWVSYADLSAADGTGSILGHCTGTGVGGSPAEDNAGETCSVVGDCPYIDGTAACTAGNIALTDADLGSMYVQWITANGECDGYSAKILHTENAVSVDDDRVWIAGDASKCGTEDFILTTGMRKGDKVYIVRAATLDGGAGDTPDTGSTVFVNTKAGILQSEWGRFIRLDPTNLVNYPSASTNLILGRANIAFFNDADRLGGDNSNVSDQSFVKNSEIAFLHCEETAAPDCNDTSAIGYFGGAGSSSPYTGDHLGGKPWDATGLEIDRVYIHDQIQNKDNGGVHAFYPRYGNNFDGNRLRLARMGDDLLGGQIDPLSTYPLSFKAKHIIATELLPDVDSATSAQCFEPAAPNTDAAFDTTKLALISMNFSDLLMAGCSSGAYAGTGKRTNVSNMVVGGTRTNRYIDVSGVLTPLASVPETYIDDFKGRVSNSILFTFDNTVATSLQGFVLAQDVMDSILSTQGHSGTLRYVPGVYRTFVDTGGFDGTNVAYNSSANYRNPQAIKWVDSVFDDGKKFATSTSAAQFGASALPTGGVTTLDVQNVYYMTSASPNPGLILSGFNQAGQTVTVDNMTITMRNQDDDGIGAADSTGNGANITNTCVVTDGVQLATDNRKFGSLKTDTALDIKFPMGIQGSSHEAYLRDFVIAPGAKTICEKAKPRTLGLSHLSVTHTLMGDLFLEQVDRWSSRDLIKGYVGSRNVSY